MRVMTPTIIAAGLMVAALSTIALAAGTSAPSVKQADAPVYRPVTSDLMNAFIEPRHIKLWLAGNAQNWEYAEYERHNIGGALARLAKAIPNYHGQSMNAMIAAFATPQLNALASAIKAKDQAAFEKGYQDLTTGCNECHQATGHAMVVMQTPTADSFPDQVFQPPSK